MPTTITRTVYQFDELSDAAKEKVRAWWIDNLEAHDYAEWAIQDAEECANILGITFDQTPYRTIGGQTRYEPAVTWGLHGQGSGASFDGTYCYAKGASKAIRRHAPKDETLHAIADQLQLIQRPFMYQLRATAKHSGYHPHSGYMSVDVEHSGDAYRDIGDAANEIQDALRRFADWMYRQIDAGYDDAVSNETVDENIRCNEYTFTADGKCEE